VKAPNKTSVYHEEPVHKEKRVLGFAPELISIILSGKKVKTYRYGDKKEALKAGDEVIVKDSKKNKIICKAVVVMQKRTTFGKLPIATPGHETYKNKEHQRKVFSGYYAYLGRKIKDSDKFLVLEFKKV
jgi:hypothetical protein